MANEKSGRQSRDEKNEYERARTRMKKGTELNVGPVGKSVISAIRNQSAPPPPVPGEKALMEVVKQMKKIDDSTVNLYPNYEPNFEAMNQRHMALGQSLQSIAWALVEDPAWRELHLATMKPQDVLKFLEIGQKMERAAMQGHLIIDAKKGQAAEENGMLNIAGRILDNPSLIDNIHDLIQDDEEDEPA